MLAACAAMGLGGAGASADPFYMGGDVSLIPFIESRGAKFADGGVTMPPEQIMVNNGANLFRLRIFVNPVTDPYAPNNYGAIQNLSYDIALAQRLKQSGAKILLDFHYSDYWADPGKQYKPADWTSLDFTQLNQTVHDYTRDTLLAFKAAGVAPEMVQVGNEIRPGMLWNTSSTEFAGSGRLQYGTGTYVNGTADSWARFGSLINSGISGVRDAQSAGQHTNIVIHIDNGASFDGDGKFYNYLKDPAFGNVDPSTWDTIGLSYYPSASTSNNLATLKTRINNLIAHQPQKIMIAETALRWSGSTISLDWASTPAGQAQGLKDLRNLGLAGSGLTEPSRFIGVQWWFPEAVTGIPSAPAFSLYNGGATAMWDGGTLSGDQLTRTHGTLPVMDELTIVSPTWNVDADGSWTGASNWINGTPNSSQVARFGPSITAPRTITLSGTQAVGSISFLSNQSYLISGDGTLSLNAPGAGPAAIGVLGGTHTVATPIIADDDLELTAAWTSSLVLAGQVSAAGKKITKYGSGTVQMENLRAGSIDLEFGTLKVRSHSNAHDPVGLSTLNSLSIAVNAKLDLTNNRLVIDDGAPLATRINEIRDHLAAGRLASSSATFLMKLGYADNSVLGLSSFVGYPVGSSSLLVDFTYAGDANLDGVVNARDLGMLASHWQSSAVWTGGDFDYDGFVDIKDLALLAMNWNAGAGTAGPNVDLFETWSGLIGMPNPVLPEPSSITLALVMALTLLFRQRIRSSFARLSKMQ